ncbi:MAG TPA: hypothetical protein VEG34_11135, partial [Thermoanaerobaculia bacterium]|nr:hypothetical protein [Thermoanaerobaculia bacterium]
AAYSERIHRLAVGFVPLDAVGGGRVAQPLRFEVEGPPPRPPAAPRAPYRKTAVRQVPPVVDRHDSCLHALLYQPGLVPGTVDLRIYDHSRRFVPRRFRVPVLSVAEAEARPGEDRVRRPALFPGAACDLSERSTGLRARVVRGGQPLRWARVEARLDGSGALVGRAQGDDRGEFVLVLAAAAAPLVELANPLNVRVTVSGPAVEPVPATPSEPDQDPLWDLPVEVLPAPGAADPVSSGEAFPSGYVSTLTSTRLVPFELGRLISAPDFVFA